MSVALYTVAILGFRFAFVRLAGMVLYMIVQLIEPLSLMNWNLVMLGLMRRVIVMVSYMYFVRMEGHGHRLDLLRRDSFTRRIM